MLKELDRDGLTDPSKWFILETYSVAMASGCATLWGLALTLRCDLTFGNLYADCECSDCLIIKEAPQS